MRRGRTKMEDPHPHGKRACTRIPTEIPTIDKTAIPTNKYQKYQPRGGGGMIPIPEKWLVHDWYATL